MVASVVSGPRVRALASEMAEKEDDHLDPQNMPE